MLTRLGGVLLVAAAMVMSSATRADAAFIAYICNDAACAGGGDLTATDTDGDGMISFSGSLGGLTAVVNTSFSKPNIGSASNPAMDISFAVSGAGTVWLYAIDTGFTGQSALSGHLVANQTGGTTANIQGLICGGQNNNNPNFAPCSATPAASFTGISGTVQTVNHPAATANPYSLTIGVNVTRVGAGVTTGNFAVVPEPATLALFGLGLIGAGVAARRRVAK